jgi:hypothetical protein
MAAKNYVHHPRSTWHPHHGTGDMDRAIKRECYIHHSAGFFSRQDSVAKMSATMRDIEHFHVATNGWSGIAYSYLVFQPYGKLKKAHISPDVARDTSPPHNWDTIPELSPYA